MPTAKLSFNKDLALSASQMREVDRVAVEKFGLEIMQMMELAAYQMASLIRKELNGLKEKNILVVAGAGNNGGDAIASARHLLNWGANPIILAPPKLSGLSLHHAQLVNKSGVKFFKNLTKLEQYKFDAVVDGILGYSIKGNVREPYVEWIKFINSQNLPTFSYDLPSGLDPNDGSIHGSAVKATHTLTLAYPKKGLFVENAKKYIGKLFLADIGIPEAVYRVVKKKFPSITYQNPFTRRSLLKLSY
jgi:NAD(P)H-hydrate epimerase